jgi:SSS family solute:Na+ symporter
MSNRLESTTAKIVSMLVKFGALAFVLWMPTTYAIQMQLLGGLWMSQLFPSVVIGAFTRWLNPWALLGGWAAGMAVGTGMAVSLGLKSSVYPLHFAGNVYPMYAAVPALLLNLLVSAGLTLAIRALGKDSRVDATLAGDYA